VEVSTHSYLEKLTMDNGKTARRKAMASTPLKMELCMMANGKIT